MISLSAFPSTSSTRFLNMTKFMEVEKILPTLLMAIDLAAGIVYLLRGNLRLFVYWVAAATLTACVTFGK